LGPEMTTDPKLVIAGGEGWIFWRRFAGVAHRTMTSTLLVDGHYGNDEKYGESPPSWVVGWGKSMVWGQL
jgi:hypothetical protein